VQRGEKATLSCFLVLHLTCLPTGLRDAICTGHVWIQTLLRAVIPFKMWCWSAN